MDLKELFNLYRRWIWLLIGCLALGLGAGFLASKIQVPVYEASAKVLVVRGRQQTYNDMFPMDSQQLVMTYVELLKTQPVLEKAESLLGIEIDPDNIQATSIANTQIIEIKVQDKNVNQAIEIANTLVQILIKENETLQGGRYATYEQSLNSQIAQVQAQINTRQSELNHINQAYVEAQLGMVHQQIGDLQLQISNLEKEIADFPAILSTVARASLTEKQTQLDQLRSLLYLYQEIQTNLTYSGEAVQGGADKGDPEVTTLQSTLGLYQQLYLNLLSDMETVKLARAQSIPTVTQIEEATIPERPIRPIPLLYIVITGMVGLLIAAFAILLIDYFDDTLRSSQQVQDVLGIRVIGEIPEDNLVRKAGKVNSANQINASLLDAFGSLRINVSRLLAQKPVRTVLIASPAPDDGKTTIAIDLARAFVQSGKKVVLLDADLNNPSLHTQFGLANQSGLSDILTKNLNWRDVVYEVDGITLITGGTQSQPSTVLLESPHMALLLEKLQKETDAVIIDGPPSFSMDSQILASKAGSILLIMRQGSTTTTTARAILDQLKLMDASVLGVVLNRAPRAKTYYSHKSNRFAPAVKLIKKMKRAEVSQH